MCACLSFVYDVVYCYNFIYSSVGIGSQTVDASINNAISFHFSSSLYLSDHFNYVMGWLDGS